jgi:hypothetical protein
MTVENHNDREESVSNLKWGKGVSCLAPHQGSGILLSKKGRQ